MKNYAPLLIAVASVFSFSCFAQRSNNVSKMENTQLMADNLANNDLAVVAYHVEERINMAFGSSVTTYEVSNLSLVSTADLGQNNSRIITPKYAKTKVKAVAITHEPAIVSTNAIPVVATPIKVEVPVEVKKVKSVNIDILSTYERVLDKGYKSVEMLQRVGNSRYFDGDLVMAAKWYTQLFDLTKDLEPVYYYRYAKSLAAVSQTQKANEMMAMFENKNK